MLKTLLCVSLSSLSLLLPFHGPIVGQGDSIIHQPKPKVQKPIAVSTLKPQEPVESIYVAPVVTYTAPVVVGTTDCGSDPNMAYIYQHESGCRTDAIGPNGPCGLGQALPCSKLPCSLSDWACQNIWFTQYCLSTYGSTYNCYIFWVYHHWW